jgi:hypothetical protein
MTVVKYEKFGPPVTELENLQKADKSILFKIVLDEAD